MTAKEATMKILLVEDAEKHIEDATAFLTAAGIDFVHAPNLDKAESALDRGDITHVITDLFFPQGRSGNSNGIAVGEDEDDELMLEPCGVAVMIWARERSLPCVICTDGHHHGDRYDWITQMGRNAGWPEMVDNRRARTRHDFATTKDWAEALKTIGLGERVAA